MADNVRLSLLKVAADFDANGYVSGANQKVAADQKMVQSGNAVTGAITQTDRAASGTRGLESLKKQFLDGYASSTALEQGLTRLQRGIDTGNVTAAEAANITKNLNARYGEASEGVRRFGEAHEKADGSASKYREGLVLFHEFLQGNWKQAVGSATIELQNFGVMDEIVGFALTGMGAAIIGTTVAVAAGVLSWVAYEHSAREVGNALAFTGDRIGITRVALEQMAQTSAASGAISTREARSLQAEYLRTGETSTTVLSGMIAITKNYAAVTGQSVDAAGKDLAKLFADPVKGAKELSSTMGILTGAQLQAISTATTQNQKDEARLTILAAMSQRFGEQGEKLKENAGLWDRVATAVSNAFDRMGRATAPATLDQQIAALQAKLAQAQSTASVANPLLSGGMVPNAQNLNPGALQQQIDKLVAMKKAADDLAASQAKAAEATALGREITELGNAADPTTTKLALLNAQLEILGRASEATGIAPTANIDAAIQKIQNQKNGIESAQGAGVSLEVFKAAKTAAAELTAATITDTVARQRFLDVEKARIAQLGESLTDDERAAQLKIAAAGATAQYAAALTDLTKKNNDAVKISNAYADSLARGDAAKAIADSHSLAEAQLKLTTAFSNSTAQVAQTIQLQDQDVASKGRIAEAALRGAQAVKQQTAAEDALAKTRDQLRALDALQSTGGIDASVYAEQYNNILRERAAIEKNDLAVTAAQDLTAQRLITEQLQGQLKTKSDELSSIKQLTPELAYQLAYHKYINDAKISANDLATTALGKQVQINAEISGELARRQAVNDKTKQITGELSNFVGSAFDRIGSDITQAFVQGQSAVVTFGNIAQGVLSELLQMFLKMALLNPLQNLIDGGNRTTGGDIASLFGKAIGNYFSGYGGAVAGTGGATGYEVIGGIGLAEGGVMSSRGLLPLKYYSGGGVANTPQVSVWGEGKMPEANVPLPDGRTIPVTLTGGQAPAAANSNEGRVTVNIYNQTSNAQAQVNEGRDSAGGRKIDVILFEKVAQGVRQQGNPVNKAIRETFGVSPAIVGR
jgi:hypothetical protein